MNVSVTPRLAAMFAAVLLSGCSTLVTPYVRPPMPHGSTWSSQADAKGIAADGWWRVFGDAQLNRLLTVVLNQNNDLAAAALRVQRARLQYGLAANGTVPKLSGNASTGVSVPLDDITATNGNASFSTTVAYEVDLWGRLAAQRDAAAFEALATEQDLAAARLAVISTTIETYWRLAHTNQLIASGEQSLSYARQAQALIVSQQSAGAASDLELREVEQTVETQAIALDELRQSRLVLRNTLGVLLNGAPSPVPEPQALPSRAIPAIRAGAPASLLARRPDLQAAELRLRGSLRGVDATRASFYPTLSLTGSLGSSNALLSFLSNPVGSLGTGLVLPFLNFKDMNLTVRVSQAQYQEAVVAFRSALLNALTDVANALGARVELADKARRLAAILAAAKEVERLTEARYKAGAVALRVWLDAQERRRAAETALASNRLAQLVNESTVYRAIGGTTAPSALVAPSQPRAAPVRR